MAGSEHLIQQAIRLLSRGTIRLWRNNTGAIRDARGQLVRFGLCVGSSDLIGFRTLEITPAMVGRRIAQFVALEVKAPNGRTTPEQQAFIQTVSDAGGLAAVVRSPEQAQSILESQP
jgi:hypothetical protein